MHAVKQVRPNKLLGHWWIKMNTFGLAIWIFTCFLLLILVFRIKEVEMLKHRCSDPLSVWGFLKYAFFIMYFGWSKHLFYFLRQIGARRRWFWKGNCAGVEGLNLLFSPGWAAPAKNVHLEEDERSTVCVLSGLMFEKLISASPAPPKKKLCKILSSVQ